MSFTSSALEAQNVINGVDVASLGETLNTIETSPELAQFQFRNKNKWIDGSLNQSTIKGFYGAGTEDETRTKSYKFYADEPPVLLGEDKGANPVEYLLHALAGCMTTTMVYHAASRGIEIEELESSLEGDIDIRGFTGISEDVPKGYSEIRVNFRVKTDADSEVLETLTKMSPVYNSIAGSVPISVNVETF
ncbi:MAG: OsmC family protein [Desulfobulbia bacterium]